MKTKSPVKMKESPAAEKPPASSAPALQQGVGARVRFLRQQRALTLDELAASCGLTKSFLSKIERGLSVPSISTAMKLAASFDMSVGQLLGESEYDDSISVVRRADRRSFMRDGSAQGYNYEAIAGGKRFKSMEPYIMRPPFVFQDDRLFEHSGQELMFVLSGRLQVQFGTRVIDLKTGDAVYFDAQVPHRSRSLGTRLAEVLVVVTR